MWSQQIIRNNPTLVPISFPTAIGDGILWTTCKRKRTLKRSLEIAVAERIALERVGRGNTPPKKKSLINPPS